MKLFFTLAAAGAVIFCPFYSRAETPLDLGDLYIWGEDRSVLEGIEAEDLFLFPLLEKSAYLRPYSGDLFEKGSPRAAPPMRGGIYLHAGGGSFDEYLFRVAHAFNIPPFSFNWNLRRNRQHHKTKDINNDRMRGSTGVYYSNDSLNASVNFSGLSDDGFLEREFYRMKLYGGYTLRNFEIQGQLSHSPGETSGISAAQTGGELKIERNIAYYNRVTVKGQKENVRINGEETGFSRGNVNYRSRMFRDFTFSLGAGVNSESGVEYGGGISGDLLETGYSVELKKQLSEFSLYHMVKRADALLWGEKISPPDSLLLEGSASRPAGSLGVARAEFSYKNTEGRIVYVKNREGTYSPANYNDNAEEFAFSASLEKRPFQLAFTYRNSRPLLPFDRSEIELSFREEISLGSLRLRPQTSLKYLGKTRLWHDKEGSENIEKSPAVHLSMAAELEFGGGMFFNLGVDNILEEKITDRGSFPGRGRRIYILGGINFPLNK